MKNLLVLFFYLLITSTYSQATCGAGYDFTYTSSATTCIYVFTPVLPGGAPSVSYYEWKVASSGTYGIQCDTRTGNTLTYQFCFHGNHTITMIIHFSGGSTCRVVKTINISCNNSLECNPDPSNSSIPNPTVEITYIDPAVCSASDHHIDGCMCYTSGGNYYNCCGWHWAIRIPESTYNCNLFDYNMEYVDIQDCDHPTLTCITLIPGTLYCIYAKLDEDIIIVAGANHCCLPAGWRRAFIMHPVPATSTCADDCPDIGSAVLCDPDIIFDNICTDRCTPGYDPGCEETGQEIDIDNNIPSLTCFTGGKKKVSALSNWKDGKKLSEFYGNSKLYSFEESKTDQQITIYNINGAQVFNGNWRFFYAHNSNQLNWPSNLGTGLYFIKFNDSKTQKTAKYYKF